MKFENERDSCVHIIISKCDVVSGEGNSEAKK